MGRRRRRKTIKIVRKRLPKYFICPRCGAHSVMVTVKEGRIAKVKCSQCGLSADLPATESSHPVDIYCRFSDLFYAGQIG